MLIDAKIDAIRHALATVVLKGDSPFVPPYTVERDPDHEGWLNCRNAKGVLVVQIHEDDWPTDGGDEQC